jgi:hypothetical protein
MAYVLTAASSIGCGHPPGKVGAGPGSPKLKVGGAMVLLTADVAGKPVTGCTAAPLCAVSVLVNPPSLAVKLKVGGQGVVLATLSGTTQSAGPPPTPTTYLLLRADSANQTTLQAV